LTVWPDEFHPDEFTRVSSTLDSVATTPAIRKLPIERFRNF
jgi:hypothetical protein